MPDETPAESLLSAGLAAVYFESRNSILFIISTIKFVYIAEFYRITGW